MFPTYSLVDWALNRNEEHLFELRECDVLWTLFYGMGGIVKDLPLLRPSGSFCKRWQRRHPIQAPRQKVFESPLR